MELNIWEYRILFKKWDKIQTLLSKKMDEEKFIKLFLDLDYRIVNLRTNNEDTFIEVMIAPKKYFS